MSGTKVLIVEDEKDIRDLISLHLKREGYDAQAIENGDDALKALQASAYDLVILDWMLPGVSGLEICKRTKAATPGLPVLMVTARADTSDVVLGLEMGADDYLIKPFPISILLARVRALLRRSTLLPGATQLKIGNLVLDQDRHDVSFENTKLDLTASEFKLLAALMQNQGRVLSRDKLIEYVQGEGITVTARSIDTHVFGLRKKLGSAGDFIETIRGVGYRIRSKAEL